MRLFTIRDFTPPERGWSEFLRLRGKEAVRAYLSDWHNLLPAKRLEYTDWKRQHPDATITPDARQPLSPFRYHVAQNTLEKRRSR